MYDTTVINIVKKSESIQLYVEVLNKKRLKASHEKLFILNDSYSDELLLEYITQFTQDTPYYYIALLDASMEQGALPTCNKHEMSRFKELATSKYICIDEKWACYTSKIDLEEQIKQLGEVGADFVFSPFVILEKFYQDKIVGGVALYALLLEDSIVLAVFKESRLLYADFIDLSVAVEIEPQDELSIEEEESPATLEAAQEQESVDLDEIDLDDDLSLDEDLDDIDSFDNLEELDNLDDIENDDELEKKLDENLEEISAEDKELQNDVSVGEKLTEDFQRYMLIQRSLATYYKDERYESEFIENVFVADNVRVTNDFKRYIQDEMFLNVYIRSIEVELEVCNLVKEELGLI